MREERRAHGKSNLAGNLSLFSLVWPPPVEAQTEARRKGEKGLFTSFPPPPQTRSAGLLLPRSFVRPSLGSSRGNENGEERGEQFFRRGKREQGSSWERSKEKSKILGLFFFSLSLCVCYLAHSPRQKKSSLLSSPLQGQTPQRRAGGRGGKGTKTKPPPPAEEEEGLESLVRESHHSLLAPYVYSALFGECVGIREAEEEEVLFRRLR